MAKTNSAPPPRKSPPPKTSDTAQQKGRTSVFTPIPKQAGHRIVLYGPGGVGKTSLASMMPGPVAMFDLEGSLPVLAGRLPGQDIRNVGIAQQYQGAEGWQEMLAVLRDDQPWADIRTIIIDSATLAEDWCSQWVLANIPHEKGNKCQRIEDYGYGKGYTHIYETFLQLLSTLDRHVRAGRHVVLICHDCTAEVPNPMGEDYIRYEPRLQSPTSGKNSIRLRVKEWADHVLFLGYDIEADKEGKGHGAGTRTIHAVELPHCLAKSRTLDGNYPYDAPDDGSVWGFIFGQGDE